MGKKKGKKGKKGKTNWVLYLCIGLILFLVLMIIFAYRIAYLFGFEVPVAILESLTGGSQ